METTESSQKAASVSKWASERAQEGANITQHMADYAKFRNVKKKRVHMYAKHRSLKDSSNAADVKLMNPCPRPIF